jgi:hypothetical protein
MAEADASLPRHMTPARTSSRWRRTWQWIVATRARRSALTLAVLAAVAAPFITGSYEQDFRSDYPIALTPEYRAVFMKMWGNDPRSCEQIADEKKDVLMTSAGVYASCMVDRRALERGYRLESGFSLPKYLAANGAVMLAAFTLTFFALTAGMAAVRKWWRWLW